MKLTTLKTLLFVIALFIFTIANAQLLVTNSTNPPYNPTYLIEDVFLGAGVDVVNVTYTGDPLAIGYFDGSSSNIGLNEGLIMTTGYAELAEGPNILGAIGAPNTGLSDLDLLAVSNAVILNAAVYTIDFIPSENTLTFQYVFGSEEYDEFVCNGFNDVFGFFISGPGFNGPFTNGAENVALIPGTTTPVAIDNINNGGLLCGPTNVAYYRNNFFGATVEYDAFTTVLETTVNVVPCSQYRIKMAIGDAGDAAYDSGVFLKASSFGTEVIEVAVNTVNSDSTIIEGCSNATVIITLPTPASTNTTIPLNIGGTAIYGVDYQPIPTSVTIPAGQTTTSFVLSPIVDNIPEGTETITFQIATSSCATEDVVLFVKDGISAPNITCATTSSSIVFTWAALPGAISYEVNVNNTGWIPANGTLQHTVNGTAGQSISIQVRGKNGNFCLGAASTLSCMIPTGCNLSTSIITYNEANCGGLCNGALGVSIIGGTPPFQYNWSNGETGSYIINLCSGTSYTVIVTDAGGCTVTATKAISSRQKLLVTADVNDAGCNAQDGEILLTVSGGAPGYSYQWSNGPNTPTIAGLGTGLYTASVTDDNGCCAIVSYQVDMVDCCPATANPCVDAIQGTLDICVELGNNPNLPLGTIDCDGDGVTNADECTDTTDPLDPCDYEDTSITLPVIADQTDCPVPCPNLTPTTTVLPGNVAGFSPVEIAVKVSEVDGVDTDGTTITVRIPSDPRLVFVWNIGLTQAAGVPIQNSDWNYLGSNQIFDSWTYNGNAQIINANSTSAFGFQAFYDPQATNGQTTITATIVPFSGGDCKLLNNTDSERLVYFD